MERGASASSEKPAIHLRAFRLFAGKLLAPAAALLCAAPCQAQLLDSLALFSRQPARFTAKLDSRGSFISNSNVKIFGIKAGLEHAGRFQYGLGYAFLSSDVEHAGTVDGRAGTLLKLSLRYATPYVEYAFYQRGPWEARIPVQVGIGEGALAWTAADGRKTTFKSSFLLMYEPAMTIQYRFLRYFGASAGWGYHLMLVHADLGEQLTAPIYLFGLKVFMGDLWRDLKPALQADR